MTTKKNLTSTINDSKAKYRCTISFTTKKNLHKIFSERKFLRIITLNNMVTNHNNIFIIREQDDIEADVSELSLECLLDSKAKETNLQLLAEITQLKHENKRLNQILSKVKNLVE